MRKILILGILAVVLFAAIGLVSAGYGFGSGNGTGDCSRSGEGFVDEDGDGVCDNWIDEDGDGFNDNRLMDGSGNQHRYGQGQGLGKRSCNGNCQQL